MADRGLSRGIRLVALAAVAGIVAGAFGVYFSGRFNGNPAAAVDCAGALQLADRVKPFARGEVAAFQVAREPDSLSGLALKKPDNSDATLAAFRGQTILLNLWATWCVPCRREMPALDRLEQALGGKDFHVVAVNLDVTDPAHARAFLGQIGVSRLAFYSDPTSGLVAKLKGRGLVFGLPTSILIDPKGCRIGAVEGPAAWDSEDAKQLIEAAIGEAKPDAGATSGDLDHVGHRI
jgi:thiol-disulfide isomerase/thioredoxin